MNRFTEAFKNGSSDTRHQKGWCSALLEELSEIIGLQVYTHNGVFLGHVNTLVVDADNAAVNGIFAGATNPPPVGGTRPSSVPYPSGPRAGDTRGAGRLPKRVSRG